MNDIASKSAQIDSVVEAIRRKGRRAIAVPADCSKEDEVKGMVEKTARELGGVDVVRFLLVVVDGDVVLGVVDDWCVLLDDCECGYCDRGTFR